METIRIPHPAILTQDVISPGLAWSITSIDLRTVTILDTEFRKFLKRIRKKYNLGIIDRTTPKNARCLTTRGEVMLELSYDDAYSLVESMLGSIR